jgi:predicted transcriptional regulator of viral defense system
MAASSELLSYSDDKSPVVAAAARVARLASDECGVLSIEELRRCGLSDSAVARGVRSGRLHVLHRGVYAVGHRHLTQQARFLAAVKACGRSAVLSHYSAAALWGFVEWDDRRPDVTVISRGGRSQEGIRVHRTQGLEASDRMRREGVPVTSPARTLLDLAAILSYASLRRAVRQAQALQRISVRQLTERLGTAGRRRGTGKLRRIVASGPAPTRSELEDAVLDLVLTGGFAHPEVNVPLPLAGRRIVPDFRWPAVRVVVEADGAAWHDNRLAREADAERQALLEAYGETVIRVTWSQVLTRPAQTLARFRAAGVPPARPA